MWMLEMTVCFILGNQPVECHHQILPPTRTSAECVELGKKAKANIDIFAASPEVTLEYHELSCVQGRDI